MNAVDVAIVAVVGLLAVLGLRRGFVLGTLDLAWIVVSLAAAALGYRRLVEPLVERGLGETTAAIVAFAVVLLAAQALFALLTGLLLRPVRRWRWPWPLRWGNGVLGMVPGAVKGLALAAVAVIPLAFLPTPLVLSEQVRASRLADPLVDLGLDALYGAVDRYQIDLGDFAVVTSRPAADGIALPFTVTSGLAADPGAEGALLRLVNAERLAAGLEPVRADPELAAVGRAHSEEMFRRGFFGHRSPTTGEPSDRLDAAGVRYLLSGENLAYAPSVEIAHRGLMESPGHRANILNPAFTRLGIGIVQGERRGLMVSQEFASG